jgi:hypothetical protein
MTNALVYAHTLMALTIRLRADQQHSTHSMKLRPRNKNRNQQETCERERRDSLTYNQQEQKRNTTQEVNKLQILEWGTGKLLQYSDCFMIYKASIEHKNYDDINNSVVTVRPAIAFRLRAPLTNYVFFLREELLKLGFNHVDTSNFTFFKFVSSSTQDDDLCFTLDQKRCLDNTFLHKWWTAKEEKIRKQQEVTQSRKNTGWSPSRLGLFLLLVVILVLVNFLARGVTKS